MIPPRIGGPYIKNIGIIIVAGYLAKPAHLKMHWIWNPCDSTQGVISFSVQL
jgi:hypothetical protein